MREGDYPVLSKWVHCKHTIFKRGRQRSQKQIEIYNNDDFEDEEEAKSRAK